MDGRPPGTVIDPTGTLTEAITTTKAPQIAQGMNKEELQNKYPYLINSYEAGMRSWLACPMFNRGEFIGPLIFQCRKENAYGEREMILGERVGRQISGAIDGSRMFAELKTTESDLARHAVERAEAATQSEAIAQIGKLLSSTLDIEEVCQPFVDEVRKLIDCDVLVINLVEVDRKTIRVIHQVGR